MKEYEMKGNENVQQQEILDHVVKEVMLGSSHTTIDKTIETSKKI